MRIQIFLKINYQIMNKIIDKLSFTNDKYNDYADMLAKSALGIGDGSFEKKEDQEWIKVR